MSLIRTTWIAPLFLLASFALLANPAAAQHYDTLITSQGGKLISGGYNDDNNTAIAPLRVFEGEVVPSPGVPWASEAPGEPGFRAVSQAFLDSAASMTPSGTYTALPASTGLFFDWMPITIGANTRNLFYWDGTGSVNFQPVASTYQLRLNKFGGGGFTETITGADAAIIPGNLIQTTTASGGVHTHLFTDLANGLAAPAEGFYLYSLRARMAGFTNSDPMYYVFGAVNPGAHTPEFLEDFEVAHGVAVGWVEANINAIPEPGTWALLACSLVGGLAAGRRWRRRIPAVS